MVIDSLCNIYVTVVASDTTLYNNITTYFTLRYDSSGSIVWKKRYNGNPQRGSIYQCLVADISGNIYVSGLGRSQFFPTYDMTTVRYSQPPYGIKKINEKMLQSFKLYQNYPNPFNPETNIKFDLYIRSYAVIKIFDVQGRLVEVLLDEELSPGTYTIRFNGNNLASGVYFYSIYLKDMNSVNYWRKTKKMVLAR